MLLHVHKYSLELTCEKEKNMIFMNAVSTDGDSKNLCPIEGLHVTIHSIGQRLNTSADNLDTVRSNTVNNLVLSNLMNVIVDGGLKVQILLAVK